MQAEILSERVEGGRNRITYQIVDGENVVVGPVVETVDMTGAELLQARLQQYLDSIQPDPYVALQQIIDSVGGAGAYDAMRRDLKNLHVTSVVLPSGQRLNVTWPESDDPEDIKQLLRERVDQQQAGRLDQIAAALRGALGIDGIKLEIEAEIPLED